MHRDDFAAHVLAQFLSDAGISVQRKGDEVRIPDFGIEVGVAVQQLRSEGARPGTVIVYSVSARAQGWLGPAVTIAGYGTSATGATQNAADQWSNGVLSTVAHRFGWLPGDLGVETSNLVAAQGDDTFGFRIHIGPLQMRVWGDGPSPKLPPASALLAAILTEVTDAVSTRRTMWLECFAVRYANGTLDATCRLTNEEWLLGEDALCRYATQWPDIGPRTWSQRQFLFFDPKDPSDLDRMPPTGLAQTPPHQERIADPAPRRRRRER